MGFDPARIETLCFAAATRRQLSAEEIRTGFAALAAKRPLRQRVVAFFLSRHAIPSAIWTPIIVGGLSILSILAPTRHRDIAMSLMHGLDEERRHGNAVVRLAFS